MRAAFAETLAELAARDRRILLLTGDLGYMALEPFSERFPDRFFNVGVAEQNMMGLATGLADGGFLPFVYSIATFASLRAYEFVRNGPVHQRLPVRIVGIGGGFEYGSAGPSHHGLEDIGIMRLQPGLTVLAPADPEQTRTMLVETFDLDGPVYYRIGKKDRSFVPELGARFALGRTEIVREGPDLLLLVLGSVAPDVVAASDELRTSGLASTVGIVSTLSPCPVDELAGLLGRFKTVLTVEAHYVQGGLGTMVSEVIAERGLGCRLVRLGVKELPDSRSGSPDYLLRRHGLSQQAIAEAARRACSLGRLSTT